MLFFPFSVFVCMFCLQSVTLNYLFYFFEIQSYVPTNTLKV